MSKFIKNKTQNYIQTTKKQSHTINKETRATSGKTLLNFCYKIESSIRFFDNSSNKKRDCF